MKPKNPGIYVRISDDREEEAKGVKRQLADCRKLVKSRGWPAAAEYNDNDKSAWKHTVVRKDFRRLLDDIASGAIDAVVVYDSDRFYRQPRDLQEFLDVCERAAVTTFAQITGDVDLSSTDGRMMLEIKATVALKESGDKSRRIKRKHLELAEKGKIAGGGTRPFGFEKDFKTIRAAEAAVVIELADRVLAGESVRSLCLDLNKRGVKTTTGRTWQPRVLTRMLKSARISGRREHRGAIVADAEWPAIIEANKSDRLRAVLSDPTRRKNERVRRYLLAGMLVCGRCGEPLTSRPRSDKRRRYVCVHRPGSEKSCGKIAILSDDLEALVVETVLQRLEGPALSRALAAREGDREDIHQRTIDGANEQLEELAKVYADQRIGVTEWMAAREPIEARLRQGERDLRRSNGTTAIAEFAGHGSALRDSWSGLGLSRQRTILASVLEYVAIGPAVRGRNAFDPDRVEPTWTA